MASSRKTKVIALSLGQGLARLVGLATTVVMARVLIKEDLAAYRQAFLAYATIAPLLSLGIGQGMYYFLPTEKERIRGRVADGITALGIAGVVFALFIGLGGNELLASRFSNPQVARLLLWMIPYAIITLPSKAAQSVFVARDRVMLASVFGVGRQLLIGAATVIPLLFWQTAEAPLVGNVIASVIMGIAAIGLMIQSTPNDSALPTAAGIKELLGFTIPIALAGMLGTIAKQMDKIIVSFMCTPDEFAVFALGAMELPLVAMVSGAITSVMLADMRRLIVNDDAAEALKLFRMIARKSAIVIFPALLFLLITADTVIKYLYTDAYSESAIPFRIYLALLPLRTVVFGALLISLGKNRFILQRSAIALILNLILSALFVWTLGPWGAVIATVATIYLVVVPANLYVLSRELNVHWHQVLPFRELGKICLAIAPLGVIALFISWAITNIHVEFAAITVCFLAYLAVYWNGRIYSLRKLEKRTD